MLSILSGKFYFTDHLPKDTKIFASKIRATQSNTMKYMPYKNAKILTILSVILFSAVALVSFFLQTTYMNVVLPLFIFYIILIINSYFSILLFLQIIPRHMVSQKIIDTLIIILYLTLGLTFALPLFFAFLLTLIFILCVVKYTLLLNVVTNQPHLLKRKIVIDALGGIMGLLMLGGVILGYPIESSWALVVIFVIANIHLFFISPLYISDVPLKGSSTAQNL